MNLLLLSLGASAVPEFLNRCLPDAAAPLRVGYLDDAAAIYTGAPFVAAERAQLAAFGYEVRDISARSLSTAAFEDALAEVDAIYVAGGNTFALLAALRAGGGADLLANYVRGGLPYIGLSAGSILVGPSITPASLMDDPADAPELSDHTGLGLLTRVIIPHADGQLPPYPTELIAQTVARYGADYPLLLLHDDQALLVTADGESVIAS